MYRSFVGPRLALLACLCACAAYAQRDLATLVGTVSDPSGGVVANAKVTITETGTGQVYAFLTSSTGEFVRPALKPSTYSVTVSAPGFRTAEQKDILLKAGERTGVNITLTIGDVGQTVEVTGAAAIAPDRKHSGRRGDEQQDADRCPARRTAQFRLSGASFAGRASGRTRRSRFGQRRFLRRRRARQRSEQLPAERRG